VVSRCQAVGKLGKGGGRSGKGCGITLSVSVGEKRVQQKQTCIKVPCNVEIQVRSQP
jgi:hypothetical protein